MAKLIPMHELDAVFQEVALHAAGASLDEIADSPNIRLPAGTCSAGWRFWSRLSVCGFKGGGEPPGTCLSMVRLAAYQAWLAYWR